MSSENAVSTLHKISTVLQELEGFTFATALDLNIGYYNIRLDTDASRICTIIGDGTSTPIRDYRGVCRFSRHIPREMSKIMLDLDFVTTYLDDLLIIAKSSLSDHLDKLKGLTRSREAGLKANADKSKFCANEMEYLGYILTRDGIKPQSMMEAILAIHPLTNVKELLRRFLEMVQYHKDMWMRRSECLHPYQFSRPHKATKAKGTKKASWHWDEIHQQSFDLVKTTLAQDVMLAYPDYSEVFEIYADASNSQIGSVITQRNRPLVFFQKVVGYL